MSNLTEFKCPNCGGPLEFDSHTQTMKCPYCGSSYTVQQLDELGIEDNTKEPLSIEWNTDKEEWSKEELDEMVEYVCKSCGGTILTDKTTAATACPFCDNPVVVNDQITGRLRPDYVIPFKLDKEAAKAGLRSHVQGKKLLPKIFTSENHIDEIKGIYVPFWLFNADVNADMRFRTSRSTTHIEGDDNVTETSYYSVYRGGGLRFNAVPVDGSSKMDDTLMESIEPFDFQAAVPFHIGYLSGYFADRYDVSDKNTITRANERIRNSTLSSFEATVVGYTSMVPQSINIRLNNGQAIYALYPVWLLNTTWHGKQYTFAMNGQTGKFVGDLPMDTGAYWRLVLRDILIVIVLFFVLFYVLFR